MVLAEERAQIIKPCARYGKEQVPPVAVHIQVLWHFRSTCMWYSLHAGSLLKRIAVPSRRRTTTYSKPSVLKYGTHMLGGPRNSVLPARGKP